MTGQATELRTRGVAAQLVWHVGGMVATSFAAIQGAERVPAFAGSDALLREFGWLAVGTILLVGLLAALWHTQTMNGPILDPTS